jgi:hypothetical protein
MNKPRYSQSPLKQGELYNNKQNGNKLSKTTFINRPAQHKSERKRVFIKKAVNG